MSSFKPTMFVGIDPGGWGTKASTTGLAVVQPAEQRGRYHRVLRVSGTSRDVGILLRRIELVLEVQRSQLVVAVEKLDGVIEGKRRAGRTSAQASSGLLVTYGVVHGICLARGLVVTEMPPAAWRSLLGLGARAPKAQAHQMVGSLLTAGQAEGHRAMAARSAASVNWLGTADELDAEAIAVAAARLWSTPRAVLESLH